MSIELIVIAVVAFVIVGFFLTRQKDEVPMDHKAPQVHNEVSKTPNGPKPAAAPAPAKKEAPKATAKAAPAKKTTKKATKKKVPVSRMNKTDLMAHAKKAGVAVEDSMTKKEILDALKNK